MAQDWLHRASRHLDETSSEGKWNRPRLHSCKLVSVLSNWRFQIQISLFSYLDDLPPMILVRIFKWYRSGTSVTMFQRFIKSGPNSHGWVGTTFYLPLYLTCRVFRRLTKGMLSNFGKIRSRIGIVIQVIKIDFFWFFLFGNWRWLFSGDYWKGRRGVYLPHNFSPRC